MTVTTHYEIGLAFASTQADASAEDFEAFLDNVMLELARIGREQIDLVATLSKFTAEFSEERADEGFSDEASDQSLTEAQRFLSDLRTALHAARCGTAKWPLVEQSLNVQSRHTDAELQLA